MAESGRLELRIFQKQAAGFIAVLLLFSFLLRLTVAIGYYNTYDTFWYRDWAVDLSNGFFSVYQRAEEISLDYPPLYLFCLYLTGAAYDFFGIACDQFTQMFLMKFWPVLFDCIMIWALWHIGSLYSLKAGIAGALLWALNPSVFFNTAMWGQTDQLMCLMLVCSFLLAERSKPVWACVLFALAGMTKFQCLYFTPVLLLLIFYRSGLLSLLRGIGAAAGTVAAVFLPFMIGSRDALLFWHVYTGGADTYPYCTLNAFNLYGCFRLNWVEETRGLIGSFSFANLSAALTFLSLLALILLFVFGKRRCGFVGGLFFMQCIFMLTVRMHERYQIAVLPFALMAYLIHREKRFLSLFLSLSGMTLCNQAMVLFNVDKINLWKPYWNGVMQTFSLMNLAIFIWSVYICVDFFLHDRAEIKTRSEDLA